MKKYVYDLIKIFYFLFSGNKTSKTPVSLIDHSYVAKKNGLKQINSLISA